MHAVLKLYMCLTVRQLYLKPIKPNLPIINFLPFRHNIQMLRPISGWVKYFIKKLYVTYKIRDIFHLAHTIIYDAND